MEKIVVELGDLVIGFVDKDGETLASVAEKGGKFSALIRGTRDEWEAAIRALRGAQRQN